MKHATLKGILAMLLMMLPAAISAQKLSLMNVELGGTPSSMAQQLKQKGCTAGRHKTADDETGNIHLKGNFDGHQDWYVTIAANGTDSIQCAGAITDDLFSWGEISRIYENVKADFTKLYGQPIFSKELFRGGKPLSDAQKLQMLHDDKCDYALTFKAENGYAIVFLASYRGTKLNGEVVVTLTPFDSPYLAELKPFLEERFGMTF